MPTPPRNFRYEVMAFHVFYRLFFRVYVCNYIYVISVSPHKSNSFDSIVSIGFVPVSEMIMPVLRIQ